MTRADRERPIAADAIREQRMDEIEGLLLSGMRISSVQRKLAAEWGVSASRVYQLYELVCAKWKSAAEERSTPERKLERYEEQVAGVRHILAKSLERENFQAALVARQQLAALEGFNSPQTLNVVHSGKVEVSDDRLPFELLRALRDILRTAPQETRRLLVDDMLQLSAEVSPTQVVETEGLRVVR